MHAWTERGPEAARDAFVGEVIDASRHATGAPAAASGVFRFHQMDVGLACAPAR